MRDIMDNPEVEIDQVLAEYCNKFMDLGALVGEMVASADGTRH